jgi:co-chaperonin GroES (HSP10)
MTIRPARGLCLVRPVATEATLPGGKILIPDASREKFASHQVEIVAVGLPEICEDKKCERFHLNDDEDDLRHSFQCKVGAWALVKPRSFLPAAHDGEKLYFVRQSDVMATFNIET